MGFLPEKLSHWAPPQALMCVCVCARVRVCVCADMHTMQVGFPGQENLELWAHHRALET